MNVRQRTPPIQPAPPEYGGWGDWWKISVTNRLLRLTCTVVGGLFVAGFGIAGAYETAGEKVGGGFHAAALVFGLLLAGCLALDLRLVWTFPKFAAKHEAVLIIHLFVGWALGLLFAWDCGVDFLRGLSLVAAIILGFGFVIAALASGIFFTLCIGGPSRVSTLCAVASVVVGAIYEGAGVLTRIEVWTLLIDLLPIDLLPIDANWFTWAWALILGLCCLYDRKGGFFDFSDLW